MSWLFRKSTRSPEDQFADEIVALAQGAGFKAERMDGFRIRLQHAGGSPVIMNLGNIFVEARQLTGEARATRLRTAVLAMSPPPRPASWNEAAPKLMPAVRTVAWLSGPDTAPPINRPLLPFLRSMCAIDAGHAMTYVTDKDLAKWGVDAGQAFDTAAANLEKQSVQVGRAGQIAVVMGPDSYTSSWLAAPAKLRRIAADVGPEVVAVAASRDSLVLVDTADIAATTKVLQEELKAYEEAPRGLSPVPYLVTEGSFQVWDPPKDHPLRHLVHKAQLVLANVEYGFQKSALDERLSKAGEDVFVATYGLNQRPDGSLWSWAVWARQVTNALVPQVDVLLVADNENKKDQFAVRWDDAIKMAGKALAQETTLDPRRWRYRGWPDASILAALRRVAVPFPPPPDL